MFVLAFLIAVSLLSLQGTGASLFFVLLFAGLLSIPFIYIMKQKHDS
jgi:hypothetical protein